MQCPEFEIRLNEILDHRGQPRSDAQLAAHASQCEACREMIDGQTALFAGLKQGSLQFRPLPATSPGFARRVVAEAAQTSTVVRSGSRSRRIGWALATVLSTAAAVLIVVSLVWQARRFSPSPAGEQVAALPGAAGVTAGQPHRKSPPSGLALTQPEWLIDAPRLPGHLRGSYQGTLDNLAVALPETVQRLDQVEHYAPGIRPIRVSFGVIFDALWRAIPGNGGDEPRPTRTSYHALDLRQVA